MLTMYAYHSSLNYRGDLGKTEQCGRTVGAARMQPIKLSN